MRITWGSNCRHLNSAGPGLVTSPPYQCWPAEVATLPLSVQIRHAVGGFDREEQQKISCRVFIGSQGPLIPVEDRAAATEWRFAARWDQGHARPCARE